MRLHTGAPCLNGGGESDAPEIEPNGTRRGAPWRGTTSNPSRPKSAYFPPFVPVPCPCPVPYLLEAPRHPWSAEALQEHEGSMAEMNRPFPIYAAPGVRTATAEVIIPVEPEPRLAPGDLEELLDEMMRRIDKALQGIFEGLPAAVKADDISIVNPPHVPFFPATFGDAVYQDQTEIYEAIEKLREETPLGGFLYDCTGRAFSAHVWVSFRRQKEADRKVSEVWTPEAEPASDAGSAE